MASNNIAIYTDNLSVGFTGVDLKNGNNATIKGYVSAGTTTNPTCSFSNLSYVANSRNANYVLTGNSNDGSSSADGIALALFYNSSGNRQLAICDSAEMASSSSNRTIRICPNNGWISCSATDNSTAYQLELGGSSGVYIPSQLAVGTSAIPSADHCVIAPPSSNSWGIAFDLEGTLNGTREILGSYDQASMFVGTVCKPNTTNATNVINIYSYPQIDASLAPSTKVANSYGIYAGGGNLISGSVGNASTTSALADPVVDAFFFLFLYSSSLFLTDS